MKNFRGKQLTIQNYSKKIINKGNLQRKAVDYRELSENTHLISVIFTFRALFRYSKKTNSISSK